MNRGVLIFAGLVAFYTVEPASAGWELEKKTDPLTDKVIATATSSYLEGTTRRAAIVRCTGLQLEVLFVFGEFLGDGNVLIKYRADRLPPVDASWLPSANGTAVFADNDADIARMLAKGTSFIIEAMDFRGQPHRSTFDLNGAAQPIQAVINQCGASLVGLSGQTEVLRKELARELERWGPRNISVNKRILASLGKYDGPTSDPKLNIEFALAVQRFYDDYLARCRAGEVEIGLNCSPYIGGPMPLASSVIYEESTGALHEEAGKLRIGD